MKRAGRWLLIVCALIALTGQSPALSAEVSTAFNYCLDYGRVPEADGSSRVPMPQAYTPGWRISALGEHGSLNAPKDMFVTPEGDMLIADTENDRIVLIKRSGNVAGVWGAELGLRQPQGVFLQKGVIYIADTGNNRIIGIDMDGNILTDIRKPDSEYIDRETIFSPRKLVVSETDIIYVVSGDNLMSIDMDGNFLGYLGETKLSFNLVRFLIRIFATQEQKSQLPAPTRAQFRSVYLSHDGYIYGITSNEFYSQIYKVNSIGRNLYPQQFYGDRWMGEDNEVVTTSFIALAVSDKNVVTTIDSKSGRLYQYDKSGENLCVFGAGSSPDKKGDIFSPAALGVDMDGTIYVLDAGANSVQLYIPTDFIDTLHTAMMMYYDGEYDASLDAFKAVLQTDNNHMLSHWGIGNVYLQMKDYPSAMKEYRLSDSWYWYSVAFEKNRQEFVSEHFGLVVVSIAAIVGFILWVVPRLRRLSGKIINRYYGMS